ncbi:hypothetical protein PFAG_04639 [Plasmodium falciparum Santa Lucia]|uniref:Uncharacterized protein n=2 Tax=Plasmodium falciparum TaxID=5833 RepID=A0A024WXV3_PLAFA|nr:hypothetical protein PFMALIP_00367 [Plasmodium falciparum MaliPS096_E11]EUT79999.1 hypothetical protein PFAG_04639 [Plasmodium falciparum Santa Lucia]
MYSFCITFIIFHCKILIEINNSSYIGRVFTQIKYKRDIHVVVIKNKNSHFNNNKIFHKNTIDVKSRKSKISNKKYSNDKNNINEL